jgi:hypothetical protein
MHMVDQYWIKHDRDAHPQQRSPAVPLPTLKNLLVCNETFAGVALRGDTYNTPSRTGKTKKIVRED